jgi:HAD superfamily hydrolase (TIGR01509 family)
LLKCVTLDFGGTLAHGELKKRLFNNRLFEYVKNLGYKGNKVQFNKARNRMLKKLEEARKINREIRLENLYPQLILELMLHPEKDVINNIHEIYIQSFTSLLPPNVPEILEYLKKKYKLAVISNSMSDVPRRFMNKTGIDKYFEVIVTSRDIGIRKPDPEIFNYVLESLEIESYEGIHIGDSLDYDVQGANNTGMKSMWIRNDYEELAIEPDFIINSIDELPSIL